MAVPAGCRTAVVRALSGPEGFDPPPNWSCAAPHCSNVPAFCSNTPVYCSNTPEDYSKTPVYYSNTPEDYSKTGPYYSNTPVYWNKTGPYYSKIRPHYNVFYPHRITPPADQASIVPHQHQPQPPRAQTAAIRVRSQACRAKRRPKRSICVADGPGRSDNDRTQRRRGREKGPPSNPKQAPAARTTNNHQIDPPHTPRLGTRAAICPAARVALKNHGDDHGVHAGYFQYIKDADWSKATELGSCFGLWMDRDLDRGARVDVCSPSPPAPPRV